MGGETDMADDRMKNDDLQRNMGGAGRDEGQNPGQQSPGRSGQGGQQQGRQGQHAGGYGGSQQGANVGGGQKDSRNMEDDEEFGAGGAGQSGQNRGGQNR
jgi:hypothetical protein